MAKVYVSSTLADLRAERQAVIDWLIQAGHQPVHSYLPDSDTVRESCLADIDRCDVYLLIVSHRYGFIPKDDNDERLSITQLEFRRAKSRNKPCLALLRTSEPDIRLSDFGSEEHMRQVRAFRNEVAKQVRAAEFSTLAEFVAAASAGIMNQLERLSGPRAAEPAQKRAVPKPPLREPQQAIVGRADLVALVLARLDVGTRDFAFEYLPGVGKTTVAAQLVRNEALTARFADGVLWAHLGKNADVRRQLEKWARALQLPADDMMACRGPAELSALVAEAIADRRMLLVIDDVWSTDAAEHFMIGGADCARVLTTRQRNVARELIPATGLLHEVRKLGTDDGFRLLDSVARDAALLAPEALRALVSRVDGLPIALVLIGNMLKLKGHDVDRIREVLQSLDDISAVFGQRKRAEYPDDPDVQGGLRNLTLGEVIEASYGTLGAPGELNSDALDGDTLRRALEALSILRPDPAWFTSTLGGIVSQAPEQALDDLCNAGMIEQVRWADGDDRANDDRRFTMHRVIAEYIRKKLTDEQKIRELNRRAADHYFKSLRRLEEGYQKDGAAAYAAWYRYENADWIDCLDNWLYYVAQTGKGAQADLAFLRAWFDGFWWWGCFTDEGFDFCDQLLRGWDHRLRLTTDDSAAGPLGATTAVRNDAANAKRLSGLDLLRRFKSAYPKETGSRTSGSWPEVVATLREIRRLAHLDDADPQSLAADASHVRAMTDIFLAEAARFGDADPTSAEVHYREALTLFRKAGDDWNSAWVGYHLADTLCSCGRYVDARALCLEALLLGRQESDPEVIANLHRVLGDVGLGEGDFVAALRDYHLAVANAYRFQVDPEPPDAYTVQFYAEIAEQVAGRLLPGASTDIGRAAMQSLRRTWSDCAAEPAKPLADVALAETMTAQRFAAQLFPPALPVEQLKGEGSNYADRVRSHLAALGDQGI